MQVDDGAGNIVSYLPDVQQVNNDDVYDFGARMFDSRTERWMSGEFNAGIDPGYTIPLWI